MQSHFWYEFLDRLVMPQKPTATSAIVAKMVADQALWSPINTVIFYASLALLEGHPADIPMILQDKLLATVVAGYCLWPLAHLINFKFVPARNRLLYINIVNLFWSIYLAKQAGTSVTRSDGMQGLEYTPVPVSNFQPEPLRIPTA
jgi:protein Mpv17